MRKLTGGVLPKDEMPRWAKCPDAAPELVERGYWRDEGDCYVIVHHMSYQPAPDKVLARQEANRRNGMQGGRPRGSDRQPPKIDSVNDSVIDRRPAKTDSVSDSVSLPRNKSQEQTHSQSESKTHRDGPGRDRTGTKKEQPGEVESRARAREEPDGYIPTAAEQRRINAFIAEGYER